ncbi:hypothetical protein LRAMOSA07250 [Lichtheimia ramosa]|uniref:AMP-dependent synthetase/ligase domain-containing protein n=1 Tax=Lichtheimia ramosa TaxID=688394 RepID=A0A077WBA7_9FUNG|nr:hypothetical protein LRAMOSA07250 [Lichtheimia ramosa]
MIAADSVPDTQYSTIYKELFESSDPRFVKDDEPLILDAMNPHHYQTFADLKRKVRSLAISLRREPFNLQEGDVVLVCIPEDVESATVMYGVTCAGCAACYVEVGAHLDEIQGVFDSMSPKAVIVHPDSLSTIAAAWDDDKRDIPVLSMGTKAQSLKGTSLLLLRDYIQDHVEECLPSVDPETPALLLQTSGSTGTPKRVNLTQRTIAARIRNETDIQRSLLNGDTNPRMLSFYQCGFGPWFSVSFICIRLGVPLYAMNFLAGFSNLNLVLSKVQEFGITLIYTLKSQSLYDIAYQPEVNAYNYDLSILRLVCTRGQPIPRDTLLRAGASLKAMMVNFFASTETGVVLAHYSTKQPYYEKIGMHAYANSMANIKVVDKKGQEASPGVEAELLVQGPMNAAGYYNRPDLTAKAFDKEGYYHTSDKFIVDQESNYINLGRETDAIKTKDGNVCFDGIKQCIAVGVLNTKSTDENPHMYIVPTQGAIFDHDKVSQLIAYINERVTKETLHGDSVTVLKELPHSNSFKVDRKKLRQMANNEINN